MSKFWGQDRKMLPAIYNNLGWFARKMDSMPDSANCDKCGHTSYTVICPHCHNMIPKEMVEHKGYIISIIGARSSGKTNYITVLIDQLRKYGSKLGNLGILASTVADERRDCTQVRIPNRLLRCPLQERHPSCTDQDYGPKVQDSTHLHHHPKRCGAPIVLGVL